MALAYGDAQPFELIEWTMAEKFGWTLEYINSLPLSKLCEFIQVEDGKTKAMNSITNRNKK